MGAEHYTFGDDGLIEATWVSATFSTQNVVNSTFRIFLHLVLAEMRPGEHIGTAFAIRHSDACSAGQWHSDAGDGRRFVTCISADDSPVNQEFLNEDPLDSGLIAVYHKEVHRRPESVAGGRIFLSATLYQPGQKVDLSCPRLSGLFTT